MRKMVFVVMEETFSGPRIKGIYSTKEKAEARVAKRKRESKYAAIGYDGWVLDTEEY
jgi:hypothetical protein